jgi:hypothetical protein
MFMILSGWNRLFVALSAVWLLLASLIVAAAYPSVTPKFAVSPVPNPFFNIITTGNRDTPFHVNAHPFAIITYIVMPVFLFWGFIGTVRWIRRGFRQGVA